MKKEQKNQRFRGRIPKCLSDEVVRLDGFSVEGGPAFPRYVFLHCGGEPSTLWSDPAPMVRPEGFEPP
ncbi:MAG: hypothetical protein V1778_03100, partial [bacterium]